MPLDWASTQSNLGFTFMRLGERESETEKLKEAVVSFHEALKELIRERVPLDWAMTQTDIGNALSTPGSARPERRSSNRLSPSFVRR